MNTYGIDVSHWEGNIDWRVVRRDNIVKFAILKATEGTAFVDDKFAANKAGCQAVGMSWGAYHFFRPGSDAIDQANLFRRTVGSGCYVYVIDVETSGYGLVQKIQEFLNALNVERKMIYTGPAFWNYNVGDQQWAKQYDLWIANYKVDKPFVPKPWSVEKIWQFTDTGGVNGIDAAVDENYFNGTEQDVLDYFKNGRIVSPNPVTRVMVNVTALNIRNKPIVSQETLIGSTTFGKVWEIDGTFVDMQNRTWFKVGKAAYLAGWLCKAV